MRNVLCRVTLLPGTELRAVSFKRQQNEEVLFQKHSRRKNVSPMLPSFPCGKHCFQCQFLFSRCKICLRYTAGDLNENPSMRALAKILRARASEHSSNFCLRFEQRPNFASNFKLDRTIRYPYKNLVLSSHGNLPFGLTRAFFLIAIRYPEEF